MKTAVGSERSAAGPMLQFAGSISDAHIVRGLIAILLSAPISGKPAQQILSTDAHALFEKLRPARDPERRSASNGSAPAWSTRIQSDARATRGGRRRLGTPFAKN